jgi:hypothetical protein
MRDKQLTFLVDIGQKSTALNFKIGHSGSEPVALYHFVPSTSMEVQNYGLRLPAFQMLGAGCAQS